MRPRAEIAEDGKVKSDLIIEVLLDIRDLLKRTDKPKAKVKRKYTVRSRVNAK